MKQFLLIFFFFLLVPTLAQAEIFDVVVELGLNKINAVEGTIVLPANVIPKTLYTGHSGILLWVKEPVFNPTEHSISFAGVTPGGFSGRQVLLTVDVDSPISIQGGSLMGYRNDGQGTPLALEATLVESSLLEDLEAPEPFALHISSSPEAFDGRTFLSFVAQDKNTGIDHYDFATTWFFFPNEDEWVRTESPRILSLIEKFKVLHVRASDKAGNTFEVSTSGSCRYATLLFGLIILVCCVRFIIRPLHSSSSS